MEYIGHRNIKDINPIKVFTILGYSIFIPDSFNNPLFILKPGCPLWLLYGDDGIPLSKQFAMRVIDRNRQNGYAIISASMAESDANHPHQKEKLAELNQQHTRKLLDFIRQHKFLYTPCYGRFVENPGTGNEEEVFERGFIVYANKKNGETDVQELKAFAVEMCNEFNQDFVVLKEPNSPTKHIDKNFHINTELVDDMSFIDVLKNYFINRRKSVISKNGKDEPAGFSFLESYIAPPPQCYSERHLRHLKGEIFVE